ncbi:Sirohydrochlorin ferrochelatase [Amycolatopsis marina]|uniref:Sirohydrochlorin ferrochelatase n=1 Tax=Amycolatopsis marina TaxID=490629 RepID=A0A1I0ZPL6_9PSEU|nr:sirohydrochlorin chelatase [Amycolatopsis marina]SFB27605.1 Sirohydrochlorin ferrochelatase [Amycolatopsis marina]
MSGAASLPLVAVAHGSRDPRSSACVRELTRTVRTAAPDIEVRTAFLDLSEPKVTDVLAGLHAEGHEGAVVVPLLLGSAFHARVDLPALVEQVTATAPRFRVSVSDVLGIDQGLEEVAIDRLAETGTDLTDPGLGVVLAAVGSSNSAANDAVVRLARRWQARHSVAGVAPAFASTSPGVPAAIARLRARGARRFAVASWFLAPGLLPDRIAALAGDVDPRIPIAAPLGAEPRVADLVLRRYHQVTSSAVRTA